MNEVVVNTHIHSFLSDGHATFSEIAKAALSTGLDAVILTDHNVFVQGANRMFEENGTRIVLLNGMEVHDQARDPQKNHLLVFFNHSDLSQAAWDPQHLIDRSNRDGALTFIAHPYDPELQAFHEPDISWDDFSVRNFTGLELWNSLSDIKIRSRSALQVAFYAFFPSFLPLSPDPATLRLWDSFLANGMHCVAIGSSDAHALPIKAGPLHRTLYPFTTHFRMINNHVQLEAPLSPVPSTAAAQLREAFAAGRLFIGYDRPGNTRGFNFTAQTRAGTAWMGEDADIDGGVTFQISLPDAADCILLCNGKRVKQWPATRMATYSTHQPGIYRVECYTQYRGRKRGWIFSNPIYCHDHQ